MDGTIATFHCAPGQFIVRPFEEMLQEADSMAVDSSRFKPVKQATYDDDQFGNHGIVDYDSKQDNYKTQTNDRLKNLTLVIPAKMTLSTADYVCENGAWMKLHDTEIFL